MGAGLGVSHLAARSPSPGTTHKAFLPNTKPTFKALCSPHPPTHTQPTPQPGHSPRAQEDQEDQLLPAEGTCSRDQASLGSRAGTEEAPEDKMEPLILSSTPVGPSLPGAGTAVGGGERAGGGERG